MQLKWWIKLTRCIGGESIKVIAYLRSRPAIGYVPQKIVLRQERPFTTFKELARLMLLLFSSAIEHCQFHPRTRLPSNVSREEQFRSREDPTLGQLEGLEVRFSYSEMR